MNRQWMAICLMLISLLFGSCKKEDLSNPTMVLVAPTGDFFGNAGDQVLVEGTAFDDEELALVSVEIKNATSGQILRTDFEALLGVEHDFKIITVLGNIHTPSGIYKLKVRVEDAAGNFRSIIFTVTISEIPLALQKTVFAGKNNLDDYTLFEMDNSGIITDKGSIGREVSGFLMDNYNQQFLFTNKTTGQFHGRDADFLNIPIFDATVSAGGGQDAFTGIYSDHNFYYTALGIPPFLKVYDIDGDPIFSFSNTQYPASDVYAENNRIYVSENGLPLGPYRVHAYHWTTKDLVLSYSSAWRITHLEKGSGDELLIAGSDFSNGYFAVLAIQNLFQRHDFILSDPVLDLVATPDAAFILTNKEILKYTFGSSLAPVVLHNESFESIAYESSQNKLYLGRMDELMRMAPSGIFIDTISGSFGEIGHIDFHYNK